MKKDILRHIIGGWLLGCLLLSGCTAEEWDNNGPENDLREVVLQLHVPTLMEVSQTRATVDEKQVSALYVYDKQTDVLLTTIPSGEIKQDANEGGELVTKKIQIPVNTTEILVVANVNRETLTEDVLESPTIEQEDGNTALLPMYGTGEVTAGTVTVNLQCVVAKVTLEGEREIAVDKDKSALYNTMNKTTITGGIPENTLHNETKKHIGDDSRFTTYAFGTPSPGGKLIAYINDSYYPIQITPITPGHWYQVKVISVSGKGYATIEDALQGNPLNIEVQIEDHRPDIFDMVANNRDELGVCNTITLKADGTKQAVAQIFTTYTPETNEQHQQENHTYCTNVVISEESDWLTLQGGYSQPWSNEGTSGYLYQYTVQADNNPSTLPRTATVKVKAGLLERKFQVVQEGLSLVEAFEEDHKVMLNQGEGNNWITQDYFGSQYQTNRNPIYGALPENMQGVSRIGLLFNVIQTKSELGVNGYTYYLPKEDGYMLNTDKVSSFLTSGEATIDGKNYFTLSFEYNKRGKFDPSYYNRSDLSVTLSNGTTTIEIPVYVNGIIEQMSGNYQIVEATEEDPKGKGEWFYYELVELTGTNSGTYIFDRNLGAKSNGLYSDENGSGDKNAIGAWYYIHYKRWTWNSPYSYYQGYEQPEQEIADGVRLLAKGDFSDINITSILSGDFVCTGPYLPDVDSHGFRVYIPIIKYLEGHTWRNAWKDEWSDNNQSYTQEYPDIHEADGYRRGTGGYYWRYIDAPKATNVRLEEDHFWWKIFHFTDTGYEPDDFRCTPAYGGHTDLYYGLQIRPVYQKQP